MMERTSDVAQLSTQYGLWSVMVADIEDREHLAIWLGDLSAGEVTIRIQSARLTGTALRSDVCDCALQLDVAMTTIAEMGAGVILYMAQEGRGHGLLEKINGVHAMNDGADTVTAYTSRGLLPDIRTWSAAISLLAQLGIARSVRLLTNNPLKVTALEVEGYDVTRIPVIINAPNSTVRNYVRTKEAKMGHFPNG